MSQGSVINLTGIATCVKSVEYVRSHMCCVGDADISVEEEDKPEQQLAKLAEVAEAAPIKHEPHGTHAADSHTPLQPQQPDTVQVRVSEAGAAEVDPLQNGHPADLDTLAAPAVPAGPAVPAASASAGAWGVAQGNDRCLLAETQAMHGADEAPTSSVVRMEYSHRPEHASARAPGVPRDHAHSAGMSEAGGVQVKDEAAGAVLGFQIGDADMGNQEEDVDIGACVKAEEVLSRQASGSSASENGQAVLMDLDAQGRQPSPAPHAKSALLG